MSRKSKERTADYFKAFPRRLEELMRLKNITQQTLADELGVSRQSVSYYCNGQSSPDWETIAKIARYFGVSSDYLLGLTDVPTPETDIRATAELTGLSSKNIERLAFWKNEARYPDYFYVLNSFLEDPRFYSLMDKIIRYLDKKTKLEAEVAKYKETKHLTSEELRAAEELKDVAYLHMYRAFDMLIDCLKHHYKNPSSTEGSAINGND